MFRYELARKLFLGYVFFYYCFRYFFVGFYRHRGVLLRLQQDFGSARCVLASVPAPIEVRAPDC